MANAEQEIEILMSADKIRQNQKEEKAFEESFSKLLSGDKATASKPLVVGKTPYSLAICGADSSLDLQIKKSVIDKCLRPEVRDEEGKLVGKTGHGLSEEQVKAAISNIKNPAMILQGSRDDSLVIVTDFKDDKDREIIAAVELSASTRYGEINNITTLYGREEFAEYINRQIDDGKVLAANEEKADKLLLAIGKKYPEGNTIISFDDSIAYSMKNVKTVSQDTPEKTAEISDNTDKTAKRENLFPVLNTMRNTLDDKLDSLNDKKLTRLEKIDRSSRKIEKLNYRAERLENTNEMLKSVFGKVPGINLLIEQNEKKIDKIKNKSIPKREQKIEKHTNKIAQIDKKIDYTLAKIDKVTAMSGIVKSFGILNNEKRREAFGSSMDLLHNSSKQILAYKIDRCDTKIAQCNKDLQGTRFTEDRAAIFDKRASFADKKQTFQLRLNKLNKVSIPFAEQKDNVTDVLIANTENKIANTPDDDKKISDLAEKISVSYAEIASRAEKGQEIDNYLKNTEMMVEDDYNSIDGIINNGNKEQELQTQKETPQQKKAARDGLMSHKSMNKAAKVIHNKAVDKDSKDKSRDEQKKNNPSL